VILTIAMAHPGKLIEQGLVSLLVAANTAAADRVHRDRVDPFKKGGIPAIALYMPDEETDLNVSQDTAPRELTRDADVELQAFVRGVDAEAVSDAMWDIQEQIEDALDADQYIAGAAVDSILKKSSREIIETDGKSDPLVGVVTMTYMITFRTSPKLADLVDDFTTVDAKQSVTGGVADTVPVDDTFTVQGTP
jgi:hypothetical protein